MKLAAFLAAASVALSLPGIAAADRPDHAGKRTPAYVLRDGGERVARHDHRDRDEDRRPHRRHDDRDDRQHDHRHDKRDDDWRRAPATVMHCPPGLAKKSPSCIPPGQAKRLRVGSVLDWNRAHLVRRPGLYGLAGAPDGQRYAIVDGQLVRVDSGTAKVLAVIRAVEAILD
ncbi:hypothetical protein SAMN05444389_101384 [Paracoccus solventivorans]|uniref:Nickel/cobalt transporter regulator n=1 Tax=Paracoccus solventivorans TaxID=53463 RepID=A0A1M7DIN1_9RHOB|nr:hypothetical protein [Paracoccus solventivorans]SHL79386.1 hypothetical protein SAMN05444389_101384 [Paracoccus solventivorans]